MTEFMPDLRNSQLTLRDSRFALTILITNLAILLISLSTATLAQEKTDSVPEDAAAVQLETVTVTARRAEEDLKEVPFSVTVVSGDETETRRLRSLEEVLRQTPGVEVNSFAGTINTSIRIRGVGALNQNSLDDSSVVISVDGVPQTIGNANLDIMDIERVEVLKGPQGTLFGRNSEAGAINVITRRPTSFFESLVRGEIGEESQQLIEGVVSGPFNDKISGRLAARYSSSDNVLTNERTNDPQSEPSTFSVRGTLLWEPTDRTTVTLIAGREELRDYTPESVLRPYGDRPTVDRPPGAEDDDKDVTRLSAEINHSLSFGEFTSVTGYAKTDSRFRGGFYEGRLYEQLIGMRPLSNRAIVLDETLFSQEFRLSSRSEDALFWVAGVNYFHTDRSFDWLNAFDEFFPANPFNATIDREFGVDSFALFGEVTYPITDALRVTGGLRHTWDDKTYDADWLANPSNPSPVRAASDRQKISDDFTTGRLALNYDLNAITTLYGVYAYGYKTAGWSEFGSNIGQGLTDSPYDAAQVNSYELGFKSETADGRFRVNGAIFLNRTRSDHLYVFDARTFSLTTENFDTESKGAELELTWLVGDGLSLSGGIAYTDATITGVPSDSQSGAREGNSIPDSPEWSGTLAIAYERPLASFLGLPSPSLFGNLTNRYIGSRPADPQNTFDLDSYNKLDLRLGVASGNAEIYLWGDNLLDDSYDLYGFFYESPFPGQPGAEAGYPGRGRTFGVGLSYYFE